MLIAVSKVENKEENEITSALVIRELYEVYLRCMQEVPVTKKDKETGKQVPTGVYQFDARGALKALQMLGDAVGVFKNNSEQREEVMSYEEFLQNETYKFEY